MHAECDNNSEISIGSLAIVNCVTATGRYVLNEPIFYE